MKVSIIVPVYGVEKYLNTCVESIVNQTYNELEIILVDDGGKDSCPKMCDEWARKDDRIIVIHKENGGQGTARNAALDIMTGDYVLFVDSDDRIMPTMVEKMLDATDSGKIDLVLCGLIVDNTLRIVNTNWYSKSRLFTSEELVYEYLTSKKIATAPFCKLISKALIADIRFPEFRANEDAYIMHQIIGNCNCAFVLSEHLYIQKIREGSTEQSPFNKNKLKILECELSLREYISEHYPQYTDFAFDKPTKAAFALINKIIRENTVKCNHSSIVYLESFLRTEKEYLICNYKKSKTIKTIDLYFRFKRLYILKQNLLAFKSYIRRSIKKVLVNTKFINVILRHFDYIILIIKRGIKND